MIPVSHITSDFPREEKNLALIHGNYEKFMGHNSFCIFVLKNLQISNATSPKYTLTLN